MPNNEYQYSYLRLILFLCSCPGESETIDIDSDSSKAPGLLTDDEGLLEGSGSGEEPEEGSGSGEEPEEVTTGPPELTVADLACNEWPCENGGTCYILGDTPMCNCALGWEGSICEDGKGVFSQHMYFWRGF